LAARHMLQNCMVDFAEYEEIESGDTEAVARFARHHGWPVRLSAARWGTTRPDVHLVRPYTALDQVWADAPGRLWLLETHEPLAPQLAVVIARRPSGEQVVCPAIATGERDCQPRRPVPVAASIIDRALTTATSIVGALDATGIVNVTFLHSHDGRLLVDELTYGPEPSPESSAPADHSLHTVHLRAILDWPLDPAPTTDPNRRQPRRPQR
ncbi:MAG: ATP-grasp domain-containing protein, partial [Ilumatobacteraceae bacterium]